MMTEEVTALLVRWRRALLALVLAVLLVVGVVVLIGKAAGYAKLLDHIGDAEKGWLAVCALGVVVAYVGYAQLLRSVVRIEHGPDLGLGLSARVVFGSLGATQLLATAGAGGIGVTYWAMRRSGFSRSEAITRTIGFNTLLWLVLGGTAWIAALLTTLHVGGTAPAGVAFPWLVLIPFCILAARYVTAPQRVERLERTDGGWLRRAFGLGVTATAFVRRASCTRVLAEAGGYWLGNAGCLWAGLRAFGVHLSLPQLVLAFATGYVATVLPLPLSGAGGFDAAMTYAVHALGVPLAPALLGVIVYRLFTFWLLTIPGGINLLLLPRTGKELERLAAHA
jgi:uncharacterized membrane protein YbhN (UPF0104 family)